MNPRGISMFYGALDAETAAFEVYDGTHQAHVAEFETLERIKIVNLTSLPCLPSIYDLEHCSRYRRLLFLADFARDIARPIGRDEWRDLEYVPSQAVCEYLRLGLPRVLGTPVHGCDVPVLPSERSI